MDARRIDETPLRRSARLFRLAGEITADLRVREIWGRVGNPVLVGSARFGLMTAPNIDFEIYARHPTEAAGAAVMVELAAFPGAEATRHGNFLDDAADPGLYWRLDLRTASGATWDFDFWFVPFSHPHAGMAGAFAEAMDAALTQPTRTRILSLKTKLTVRAEARQEARPRGIDIYRAVLKGGVRTVREYDAWRKNTPQRELETWRPEPV